MKLQAPPINLRTLSQAITTYNLVRTLVSEGKNRYDNKTLYTAKVPESAWVFPEVMMWLNQNTSSKRMRFINDRTGRVSRYFDANGTQKIEIEGYKFEVRLAKPDIGSARLSNNEDDELYAGNSFKSEIIFNTRQKDGLDALQRMLESLAEDKHKKQRKIYLYSYSKYGWSNANLPARSLDSVFLPRGVKEELMGDIEMFNANESHFNKIGIPYHRGYLFYGPPGNGKSSLALALANHYRLNVYTLSLSSIDDDKMLNSVIHGVGEKSILLIEDIDIFSNTMGRTQADKGPTLAGLLNSLDGIATPHGLLTIMTTNHPEMLDPALVRNGRVDFRLELLPPDVYQINSMFEFVYRETLSVEPRGFESMAELAEIFKMNPYDVEAARAEIKA